MELYLTLQEAKLHHKELVKILFEKLRASGTRDSEASGNACRIYYSYGMVAQVLGVGDTSDNSIEKKLGSVIGLSLAISAGRTRRYVTFDEKPQLFIEKFSERYKNENPVILGKKEETKTQEQTNEVDYSLNDILDKISSAGIKSLTDGERKFLESHS